MADRVLIVAAEASSALYAQRLLEEWQTRGKKVEAFGVGSEAMAAHGFNCLGHSEDMAVVGFKEVFRHYGKIRSVFDSILDACKENPPKYALLLDYPDFNLRLAKKLHEMGIKVIYYISPQLWAWRKGRIKQVKDYVDKVLVLFPFEDEFYKSNDVKSAFVGHPLLDELNMDELVKKNRDEQRSRHGISELDMLIGLMPGSRQSELDHHLETQMQTAALLYKKHPSLRFALLVAPSLNLDEVRARLEPFEFPMTIVKDEPLRMVNMTDYILTASGTATLVVGLLRKPMVVMYKMNSMSAWLAKMIVKGVDRFAMVNLILSRDVVPEFFQEEASPEKLSAVLSEWVEKPELAEKISIELAELHNALGEHGATKRVADELEEYLG